MQLKTLYAFVGGAAVAAVIAFLIANKQNEAPPVPAPVAVTQPEPAPYVPAIPEPVVEQPEVKPAPAAVPVKKQVAPRPVQAKVERPVPAPPAVVPPSPAIAKSEPVPQQPSVPVQQEQPPARTEILRPDALEIQRAKEERKSETVTLPAGTVLHVRLNQSLSSKENENGDTFSGTLDEPLVANGFVIAERGARVDGRVIAADQAGRVKGLAQLSIALFQLHTADNQRVAIATDDFLKVGESSKKSDAAKVGIATGVGAALGAIFGGGKGAAIGAASGGAAGTGAVLVTRGKPAEISVETRIPFRLREDVLITENLN